jgi:hypothetical protein
MAPRETDKINKLSIISRNTDDQKLLNEGFDITRKSIKIENILKPETE